MTPIPVAALVGDDAPHSHESLIAAASTARGGGCTPPLPSLLGEPSFEAACLPRRRLVVLGGDGDGDRAGVGVRPSLLHDDKVNTATITAFILA